MNVMMALLNELLKFSVFVIKIIINLVRRVHRDTNFCYAVKVAYTTNGKTLHSVVFVYLFKFIKEYINHRC